MQTIIFSGGTSNSNLVRAENYVKKIFPDFSGSPDFLLLQKHPDKNKIGIEEAKKCISFGFIKPSYWSLKVILIHEAHFLSIEAQNALLKTLEEPPEYLHFIFTVDHPSNLLQTILSRSKTDLLNEYEVADDSVYAEILSEYQQIQYLAFVNKIDWIIKYKSKISDRDFCLGLIDQLIYQYHQNLCGDGVKNNIAVDKARIEFLFRIKDNILKFNANPLLCVESFLANI